MSDADSERLEQARYVSLTAYKALCGESLRLGRNYYPMKPKCHIFDHAMRDAFRHRLSPTSHWCFADEDFIGRVKKMAMKTHLKSLALRVLQRWLLRVWVSCKDQAMSDMDAVVAYVESRVPFP